MYGLVEWGKTFFEAKRFRRAEKENIGGRSCEYLRGSRGRGRGVANGRTVTPISKIYRCATGLISSPIFTGFDDIHDIQDNIRIDDLTDTLKNEIQSINAIVILLKGNDKLSLGSGMFNTMKFLEATFGKNIWKNAIIVVSFWSNNLGGTYVIDPHLF